MAVTIVGEDPAAKKRVTCGECAAVLEYTRMDVRQVNFPDYTGNDFQPAVACPKCSNKIIVRS